MRFPLLLGSVLVGEQITRGKQCNSNALPSVRNVPSKDNNDGMDVWKSTHNSILGAYTFFSTFSTVHEGRIKQQSKKFTEEIPVSFHENKV